MTGALRDVPLLSGIRLVLRLAARNASRRKVRTALTAGMVVLGVALLLLGLSWLEGILGQVLEDTSGLGGHVRIIAPEYAAREELLPLDANLPNIEPLAALIRAQPGVVAVEPRILTGVTVTAGREIGDVFAAAMGAPESYYRLRLHAADRLVKGTWFTGAPDELVIGAQVAKEAKANVGAELVLLGQTQDGAMSPLKGRLVGIVSGGGLLDRQVLVPLERIQWLTDITGGATELLVFASRYEQGPALAARLRALPGLKGLTVQAWDEHEPLAGATRAMNGVRLAIMGTIVFLAALGIWNTMMTSVLERTREIGVLRAMGLSRTGVVALVVSEAAAIAVVGGAIGVALGGIPAWFLQTHGIRIGAETIARVSLPMTEVMHARLTPALMLGAFGLGLAMAVLGAAPAAFRAASIQPVTAMRSGR